MKKSTHSSRYTVLRDSLKELRNSNGMSQRALASKIGVPHSWVAKVESGERRIDLIELCWFAEGCGCDPTTVLPTILKRITRQTGKIKARGGKNS